MRARDEINAVRIVTVTRNGADAAFGSLGARLKRLSPKAFVAIDTEFSGFGSDPALKEDNFQARYAALRNLAHSCGILSIGISVFDAITPDADMPDAADQSSGDDDTPTIRIPTHYSVSTYDFVMFCNTPFSMVADSGQFLVAHGFDFNRMFRSGIPYDRASSETPPEPTEGGNLTWTWGKFPRGLLWRIGHSNVPVVVHNGLFDLVFLFASFQGPLPGTLSGFISALTECLPEGFWDSKVIAASTKERSSFLAYLFAKSVMSGRVSVKNSQGLPSTDKTDPPELNAHVKQDVLCALYSFRGFCPRGVGCPFTHDPFKVLEEEKDGTFPKDSKEAYKRHKAQSKLIKKQRAAMQSDIAKLSKKQKKKLIETSRKRTDVDEGRNPHETSHEQIHSGTEEDVSELENGAHTNSPEYEQGKNERQAHTAGWDAFCTGYVFAAYRESCSTEELDKVKDRIAVPYKPNSLLLAKSQFADLDSLDTNGSSPQDTSAKTLH
ncbi:Target of EGR1 protein 1 [Gracilariopsis chorda]|uniref:Target of EGR1 protein 1 n=1 Tax=Gracilariopsis chorda TaxID=448386 RepID=A0A2V3IU34_9FLOR|nr:Target of EGR1 protein 1 [Gracilariopsis chorda]|eukprot:PXF45648.1 Target of EGR1 protein 1 [Gracilariopsis chorda]